MLDREPTSALCERGGGPEERRAARPRGYAANTVPESVGARLPRSYSAQAVSLGVVEAITPRSDQG